MKPNIAFDTSSVLFLYCDAGGSNIAQEHIDFFDHYKLDEAKHASVVAWDSRERTRIHGYNMKWVVFWTRLRLARYLAARNMQASTNLVQWNNVRVGSKRDRAASSLYRHLDEASSFYCCCCGKNRGNAW
jgi:hypothetical protein